MARIDYYLTSLQRFGAMGAVLVSGAAVALRFPTGDRYASHSTSHADLVALVEEVAPATCQMALREGSPIQFQYRFEGKTYRVQVEPQDSRLRVIIHGGEAFLDSLGGPAVEAPRARTTAARAAVAPVAVAPRPPPGPAPQPVPVAVPLGEIGLSTAPQAAPDPFAQLAVTVPTPPPAAVAPRGAAAPAPAPRPAPAVALSAAPAEAPREPARTSGATAVERLLVAMKELGASDLHLATGAPPMVRLHGEIRPLAGQPPFEAEGLMRDLLEITPEKNREEFEQRHDTDFAIAIPRVSRFRANLFIDRNGPGAVFRAIPFQIIGADQLGLPRQVLDLCYLNKGLVLVTGPTGSGKSTTLASLVDHVNKSRTDHIITIEDPIEFVHDNKRCLVTQREVHTHTRSFKDALRAALREDPDIVLVGEMRDLETIAIAVETAETGHLVFGTLHTTTAPSTVDRIIDQFPTDRQDQIRQMLAESLRGVIAQTLCKKIGGGRVAAYEILLGTHAVSNLIRERKTFQLFSLMQTGRAQGMVMLNDSLLDLVKRGVVDPNEALAKAVNKAEFRSALAREGIQTGPVAASAG